MKHICAKCGALAEVTHPALVAAGRAMAARITPAQRRAWGAKGGAAKRRGRAGLGAARRGVAGLG